MPKSKQHTTRTLGLALEWNGSFVRSVPERAEGVCVAADAVTAAAESFVAASDGTGEPGIIRALRCCCGYDG